MAKKVYGMYFSGTGTTKKMVTYIASELASKIGGEYVEFDFTLPGVRKEVKEYEKRTRASKSPSWKRTSIL